jgi:hypothetical protein
MQPSTVSLDFEDNRRFHDDLVLRLGDEHWRCDSYYLLLDRGMLPDQEDAGKVRAVLRRLLEQWHACVASLGDRETCYLPYDFSDEYTAWLRCEAAGADLRIQRGWAEINGYTFFPSNVGELLRHASGRFRPDGAEMVMPRREFLRQIAGEIGDHIGGEKS